MNPHYQVTVFNDTETLSFRTAPFIGTKLNIFAYRHPPIGLNQHMLRLLDLGETNSAIFRINTVDPHNSNPYKSSFP